MNKEVLKIDGSKLYFSNGALLGEVLAGDDGFYCFWPELNGGFWEAYVLKAIADYLDELNKPVQKDIGDYFNRHYSR